MLAVSDPFYKITSEALLVTQQLVKVMRPLGKRYLVAQAGKFMRFVVALLTLQVKASQ